VVAAVTGALSAVVSTSDTIHGWFVSSPQPTQTAIPASPTTTMPFRPTPVPSIPVPDAVSTWPVPASSGRIGVVAVHASLLSPDHDCPEVMPGRVYPRPLQELAGFGPAVESDSSTVLDRWAAQHGGVSAAYQKITVTVQSLRSRAVLLTSLEIRLTRRAPPLAGTHLRQLIAGCGGQPVRAFAADLDRPLPYPQPLARMAGEITKRRIASFPFRITDVDPEYIELYVYTLGCDCSWVAVLHWTADGAEGSTVLLDNGKPFRVTSTMRAPGYTYSRASKQYDRAEWTDFRPEAPFETQ
jgi:hypothetical protein